MAGIVYPLWSYGRMIADRLRMDAYEAALRASVKPGDIVFDLGSGPGVFAILAARLGARKAIAVDVDPSVRLAPQWAAAEGLAGKVEAFEGLSTVFDPPERADVIVADLRGSLPLYGAVIPSLADARKRLLKPGGTLIPASDRLLVALVECPETYAPYEAPWRGDERAFALDFARKMVVNHFQPLWLEPGELLGAPQVLADIDYATADDPDIEGELTLAASRDGTVHGYAIWFETQLTPEIGFATGPDTPSSVYRQLFFPLEEPVRLAEGQEVRATIGAKLVGGRYRWFWRTRVAATATGESVDFRQASDFAELYATDFAGNAGIEPGGL